MTDSTRPTRVYVTGACAVRGHCDPADYEAAAESLRAAGFGDVVTVLDLAAGLGYASGELVAILPAELAELGRLCAGALLESDLVVFLDGHGDTADGRADAALAAVGGARVAELTDLV